MPFSDLREFLKFLEEHGELLKTKKPVDTKFEISSYIRKTSDQRGPALFFENVKNFDMPVVGGIFATRERAFLALETSSQDYVHKFQNALDHLLPPKLVSNAPCKDVIHTGNDVDLTRLPIPIFSEKDPAAFITLGLSISR
ncbi:MAG TPA: UbiD family decarboxylase, partial [Candidatus Bathyarchaeia archaeon]|nr:UbiD family decarboxylase [Candidatus Bathyarchaeia archaeon]